MGMALSSVALSIRKGRVAVKQPALKRYGHPELSVGFNLVRTASCWLNRTFNDSRQVVDVWRHAFQVDVCRSGPLMSQEELDVSQPRLV